MSFFGKKEPPQTSIQLEHHLHTVKIPANLRINDQIKQYRKKCAEFYKHMVHIEHTAMQPGNSLLLPEDDFSVRLSYVYYNGDEVLRAWQQKHPVSNEEKETFFEKHCPLIVQGINNIERYFSQVKHEELPVHL